MYDCTACAERLRSLLPRYVYFRDLSINAQGVSLLASFVVDFQQCVNGQRLSPVQRPRGRRTTATPDPSAAYNTATECPMPISSAAMTVTLLARLSEPRALGASSAIERRSVVEIW